MHRYRMPRGHDAAPGAVVRRLRDDCHQQHRPGAHHEPWCVNVPRPCMYKTRCLFWCTHIAADCWFVVCKLPASAHCLHCCRSRQYWTRVGRVRTTSACTEQKSEQRAGIRMQHWLSAEHMCWCVCGAAGVDSLRQEVTQSAWAVDFRADVRSRCFLNQFEPAIEKLS